MSKRLKLELTTAKAERIAWALKAGLEQQRKFLRHDNWDDKMTKRQRHQSLQADREMQRAIDDFIFALFLAE